MEHKWMFSGEAIDLSQSNEDVKNSMNEALWRFYPKDAVFVHEYETYNDGSVSVRVCRRLKNDAGCNMEGICDFDMSMLTGMDISAFRKDKGNKTVMNHLHKCKIDGFYYAPIGDFCGLWKQQNKVMLGEKIETALVRTYVDNVFARIKFKEEAEHDSTDVSESIS